MTSAQTRAAAARRLAFRAAARDHAERGTGPAPIPAAPRPGPLAAALSTAWVQAAARPISEAADAALHDLERAAHRPGGRILPRSRWSADERNAFGNWA